MKTTAKIEYRSYVPSGYIAMPFTNIEIYGDIATEQEWETEETKIHKKLYGELKEAKKGFKEEKQRREEWRVLSFWNNFKKYPKEGHLKEAHCKYYTLRSNLVETHAWEDRYSIKEILRKNGYIIIQSSSSGGQCETIIEIWEKSTKT